MRYLCSVLPDSYASPIKFESKEESVLLSKPATSYIHRCKLYVVFTWHLLVKEIRRSLSVSVISLIHSNKRFTNVIYDNPILVHHSFTSLT